jgi:hypothetical protein
MKKTVVIKGVDLGSLKRGESAIVLDIQHRWLKTSPVVAYTKAGGCVWVETLHTIYTTHA